MLDPDHPLLKRVQEVLKSQLTTRKTKLEEELREKKEALKVAKQKREDVGVDLYGFQQNLAKLQLMLEKSQDRRQAMAESRRKVEEEVVDIKRKLMAEEEGTKQERVQVDAHQQELDKLGATLRQIERYNEEMKSEIEVTKRAAAATEEAVQRLEKEKLKQDYLIDSLQGTLKKLHGDIELYTAQREAQQRETRAALETLAEAEAEMEGVHFEKKQLVAQWRSCVTAVQRRDEALAAIQDALHQQQQQEISMDLEVEGYKKDISKEQIRNEQLTLVVKRVEGESDFLTKQIAIMAERQEKLQETMMKLQKSLEATDEKLKKANLESKALVTERSHVDWAIATAGEAIKALEDNMMEVLSEQTTTEKSSMKTAADIRSLRKKVASVELVIAEGQNELAKLQVDLLNTEAHNERLADTMRLLDSELEDKARTISKYELELRRRNDEMEKTTREIDQLNRKYEKAMQLMEGTPETGPLESAIHHLEAEIDQKAIESKNLQKRWVSQQKDLVRLQNENNTQVEALSRLKAEHTVLLQKCQRLDHQHLAQEREIKELSLGMERLRNEMQSINRLIANNGELSGILQEDNYTLEGNIRAELADLEEATAKIQTQIDQAAAQKQELVADVVEAERQILLWEKKIQLEKEMQDVLDPTVGNEAVEAMRKEVNCMSARHHMLMKAQEKLIMEMERALSKHELLGTRAQAKNMMTKKTPALTEGQAKKVVSDMEKTIRDMEKEVGSSDQRTSQLRAQGGSLRDEVEDLTHSCDDLRSAQEGMKVVALKAHLGKQRKLVLTSRLQKTAKKFEDMDAGRYRAQVEDPSLLKAELQKADDRKKKVLAVLEELKTLHPQLETEIDRITTYGITMA